MSVPEQMMIQALDAAVCDTLENMAFVDFDKIETVACPFGPNPDSLHFEIELMDQQAIRLRLVMARSFAEKIVADMCGDEFEDVNQEMIDDMLAELINTIGGRFSALLLPDNQRFTLSLPRKLTTRTGADSQNNYLYRQYESPQGGLIVEVGQLKEIRVLQN